MFLILNKLSSFVASPATNRYYCSNLVIKRLLNSTQINENHYDIIIAGGGMIGTTLACTLGKNPKLANKRILLLEGGGGSRPQSKPPSSSKYSNRVSSLSPGTNRLLVDIGVWTRIAAPTGRVGTIKKMQVWDGVSDAVITFGGDGNDEVVAHVVENDLLLEAVTQEVAAAAANVEVLYEARIRDCRLSTGGGDSATTSEIRLDNGAAYTCELLLGCDGANSQVRKSMGVQYLAWNYNQMGIVATLKLSENGDENVVAWQRFLPTGPIAVLPLSKNRSSLVWSTTPSHAKELLKLPEDQFVDAINNAIWKKYQTPVLVESLTKSFDDFLRFFNCPDSVNGRQLPPSVVGCDGDSRAAFPLGFGHATNYIGKGVALVGDAAHRVHPLAGQGVNLGFGDIVCLNQVLGDASYSGSPLGNLNYLKQYETDRQRHNMPTMLGIEGLHRLYSTNFTPIVLLRSLGLQATHAFRPLKRAIIAQAV